MVQASTVVLLVDGYSAEFSLKPMRFPDQAAGNRVRFALNVYRAPAGNARLGFFVLVQESLFQRAHHREFFMQPFRAHLIGLINNLFYKASIGIHILKVTRPPQQQVLVDTPVSMRRLPTRHPRSHSGHSPGSCVESDRNGRSAPDSAH